jgi:hypothetical protein
MDGLKELGSGEDFRRGLNYKPFPKKEGGP